jgi:cell division septal protein FtsQ
VTVQRRALLTAGAVALLALTWFGYGWFRDSSLVKVRHVEITGVSNSPDAAAIKRQLRQKALGMTTLSVDTAGLRRAVSGYPIVRSVSASGNFPSTLGIAVHEYVPIAALTGPDGRAVPVAYDGTLLPRVAKTKLPAIAVTAAPERDGFESKRVRTLGRVLAAAPAPLRPQLQRAFADPDRGIVVAMRDGPELELGTSARLPAKWASAARVLAAPSSSGADEIDVRLPERPSARGFASAQNPQL